MNHNYVNSLSGINEGADLYSNNQLSISNGSARNPHGLCNYMLPWPAQSPQKAHKQSNPEDFEF
jgi:hypothetical protein